MNTTETEYDGDKTVRWCVVQYKPQELDIAVTNLRRQDFDVFLPQIRERHRKGDRTVPMFPGYLFVAIDLTASGWLSIVGTKGVKRILTIRPDMPALLPRGWVESLKDKGVIDQFMDAMSFRKGDSVEIVSGPFEGHIAICKWTSERRIGVLFDCMGRESVLICNPNMLRAAEENIPRVVR